MKKFLGLAAIVATVISAPIAAQAADAMVAVPYDWTGFYAGAQIGIDMVHPNSGPIFIQPEATGLIGGVNVQGLWQSGSIVFGGVADFNGSTAYATTNCGNPAASCEDGSNWNGSLRAKLGFAADNVLLYGTGGWGWADYHGRAFVRPGPPFNESSVVLNGWVVGAGLAYAINDKWSLNAEYLHYDLGSANTTIMKYNVPDYPVKPNMDTVTLGISYKF